MAALRMAYYVVARRGLDSLMGGRLSASARLSPGILHATTKGLVALREVELSETSSVIFTPGGCYYRFELNCPSCIPTGPIALEVYQDVFDRVVGSSQPGARALQVPEFLDDDLQCVCPGLCDNRVERWESGHLETRKKV